MGDREKGELNAAQLVFSEALAAACTRHIHKNMEKQRLVTKRGSAANADERDDWMQVLQRTGVFPDRQSFYPKYQHLCGRIVNS